MNTITIDRDHGDAVYAQVAEQLRQLIASGALPSGTAIPSVRQLARDLGVSLNTIARAFRTASGSGMKRASILSGLDQSAGDLSMAERTLSRSSSTRGVSRRAWTLSMNSGIKITVAPLQPSR